MSAPTTPAKKSPLKPILANIIIWVVIIIIIVGAFFRGCTKNPKPATNNEGTENSTSKNKAVKSTRLIHVHFTGQYGQFYQLEPGNEIDYKNATTKYCRQNKNGQEVCAEEVMENVTGKTHDDPYGNRFMQFKSVNGDEGDLDIILTPLD